MAEDYSISSASSSKQPKKRKETEKKSTTTSRKKVTVKKEKITGEELRRMLTQSTSRGINHRLLKERHRKKKKKKKRKRKLDSSYQENEIDLSSENSGRPLKIVKQVVEAVVSTYPGFVANNNNDERGAISFDANVPQTLFEIVSPKSEPPPPATLDIPVIEDDEAHEMLLINPEKPNLEFVKSITSRQDYATQQGDLFGMIPNSTQELTDLLEEQQVHGISLEIVTLEWIKKFMRAVDKSQPWQRPCKGQSGKECLFKQRFGKPAPEFFLPHASQVLEKKDVSLLPQDRRYMCVFDQVHWFHRHHKRNMFYFPEKNHASKTHNKPTQINNWALSVNIMGEMSSDYCFTGYGIFGWIPRLNDLSKLIFNEEHTLAGNSSSGGVDVDISTSSSCRYLIGVDIPSSWLF